MMISQEEENSQRKGFFEKIKDQPLVGVGCLATVLVLGGGLKSFYDGNSKRGQNFMRFRILAQASTVCILAIGGAYLIIFCCDETRRPIRIHNNMTSTEAPKSMGGHDPTIYTTLLVIICFSLMIFLVVQLVLSMHNRNKLLSWSTCFYLMCLVWTVVRVTYWVMLESKKSMSYLELYLLYWFPTPLQFSNFSLLVLFYIQVITGPTSWRQRWKYICIPVYLLLSMSMATFTVVWAFNSSNEISNADAYGDEYDQEFYRVSDVKVQLEYSAISFFTLSVLFGFFGWKMVTVESWKRKRMLISKPRSLAAINFMLCLIFFTRSIRDLATSQSWFLSIWNQLDMNGRVTTFAYFVFFCFWEFLPTVLLLMMITSKAGGVGAPRNASFTGYGSKLPDFGIFHVINSQNKLDYGSTTTAEPINVAEQPRWTNGGDLFEDPLRYDSDDATSAPIMNSLNSDSATSLPSSYDRPSSYTHTAYTPL